MTITAQDLRASLNKNAQERSRYESAKDSKELITAQLCKFFDLDHKTLESNKSDMYFEKLAASNVITSYDMINNHVKENQRFNIKALHKVAKKLDSIVADKVVAYASVEQKFCVAAVLTCIQNKDKESFTFTRKHALAMLSRAMRFDSVKVSELARKFAVAESTAMTQVSSSFRTLEALDVLRFDDSEQARCVVSDVNYDHAFVQIVIRDILAK